MAVTFTKKRAKMYRAGLLKMKRKQITVVQLAQEIGTVVPVLQDHFAHFDPMVRMDPDYNLLDLIPQLDTFLVPTAPKKRRKLRQSKPVEYESIGDFIYRNFTVPGGIVDQHIILNDRQILDLKRLVQTEWKQRREKKGR